MAMQRPMRRADRALSSEETQAVLREGEYGVLSLIGDEGAPYGVPLSFIWLDGCVYIHCAKQGYKLDCLRADARVSFAVVTGVQAVYHKSFTTNYRSAILSGTAQEVMEEGEKGRALAALCDKYLPGYASKVPLAIGQDMPHTAVWKIVPAQLCGKGNQKETAE